MHGAGGRRHGDARLHQRFPEVGDGAVALQVDRGYLDNGVTLGVDASGLDVDAAHGHGVAIQRALRSAADGTPKTTTPPKRHTRGCLTPASKRRARVSFPRDVWRRHHSLSSRTHPGMRASTPIKAIKASCQLRRSNVSGSGSSGCGSFISSCWHGAAAKASACSSRLSPLSLELGELTTSRAVISSGSVPVRSIGVLGTRTGTFRELARRQTQ
jgi:hypothetical protein